jgi:hypothetical protein
MEMKTFALAAGDFVALFFLKAEELADTFRRFKAVLALAELEFVAIGFQVVFSGSCATI